MTQVTSANSPYTVLATDTAIEIDASGGDVQINFPDATTVPDKVLSLFTKTRGVAPNLYHVGLNSYSGQKIVGATRSNSGFTLDNNAAQNSLTLQCNGIDDWYQLASK